MGRTTTFSSDRRGAARAGLDLVTVTLGWTLAVMAADRELWIVAVATGVMLAQLVVSGSLRPLAGSLDTLQHRRVVDAGLRTTLVVLVVAGWSGGLDASTITWLVLGATSTAVAVIVMRSTVLARRGRLAPGREPDRVLIVGDHREAHELLDLIDAHPETRWQAAGWVDGSDEDPVPRAARRLGVSTVLVAPSALRRDHVAAALIELRDHGVRVHLDTGIRGCDRRRVSLARLGTEPLLVLEPRHLDRIQQGAKRGLDVVVAGLVLLATLPLLTLIAIAVKLEDRGPVLFRQRRVGRHGIPFSLVKFRTMRVGAEGDLGEIAHLNERRDGPLFKLHDDPRVTRIGRILRATSLDEIPQLWHVIRGQMSLVGPRPALPDEVRHFDDRLLARHRVRPGITGVWQVRHRDDASFETYRRSDLFYLANWSLGLDLALLIRTLPAVAGRGWRGLRQREVPTPEPVAS